MSNQFAAQPIQTISDVKFDDHVRNVSYSQIILVRGAGKASKFEKVDFSFSRLDDCYFHQAEFVDCKFVGTRISSCVFRSARFVRCDFRYAQFNRTVLPYEEVLKNLPTWENIANDLIRSLKANASEMGDFQYYNRLILTEIENEARRVKKAVFPKESYYIEKYSRAKRAVLFFQLLKERIGGFIWNHGYSAMRIIRFFVIILIILSLAALLSKAKPGLSLITIGDIWKCITTVGAVFIDFKIGGSVSLPDWIVVALIILRYFFWGMVVSIVFNRSIRR